MRALHSIDPATDRLFMGAASAAGPLAACRVCNVLRYFAQVTVIVLCSVHWVG